MMSPHPLPVGIAFAILLVAARPATAQHETFIEALVDFTTAVAGTFGDEGDRAREALARLDRGLADWDRTLDEYESNVEAALPTAPPARALEMHTTMGSLYVARGRLAEALREFEAAARLAPDRPLLHTFRGLVHEAAGRSADALEAFRRAWELDPADPIASYTLASRSIRLQGSPPEAAFSTLSAAVDSIAAQDFPWRPAPFVSTALLRDDASETALFVPSLYGEAFELFDHAEYTRAVEAVRDAASRDPLLAGRSAAMIEGSTALREGRVDEAIARFMAAARETPDSEASRMLGMAYWLAADYERSVEQLEEAIRLAPGDERARLTLARVLEEIGQDDRAEQLLVETVAALPSSSLAHWRLGRRYASANRTSEALRELELAVGAGVLAGEGPLHLEIAVLHRRELDAEAAATAFGRAIALRPNDGVAHRELGRALLQMGRPDAAAVELAASLIIDPQDHEACVTLGQIYLDAERHADAARILAYAAERAPDHAEARYALATALMRLGRREDAAPHLEAFQRLQQQATADQRRRIDLSVLKLEADIRNSERDFARAAALWARLVVEEPEVPAHHAGLAEARAGLGQLDEAIAHYEKAIALGAMPAVYRQLATLYEQMGRSGDSARTRARLARAQQESLDAAGASR